MTARRLPAPLGAALVLVGLTLGVVGVAHAWSGQTVASFAAKAGTWRSVPAECTGAEWAGATVVFLTAGDSPYHAGNGKQIIVGTEGDDVIYGGSGKDCVAGGDGADTLAGNNGSDLLFGGPGDDVITGGNGPDAIGGGPGSDTCDGGQGPDTIVGCEEAPPTADRGGEAKGCAQDEPLPAQKANVQNVTSDQQPAGDNRCMDAGPSRPEAVSSAPGGRSDGPPPPAPLPNGTAPPTATGASADAAR